MLSSVSQDNNKHYEGKALEGAQLFFFKECILSPFNLYGINLNRIHRIKMYFTQMYLRLPLCRVSLCVWLLKCVYDLINGICSNRENAYAL